MVHTYQHLCGHLLRLPSLILHRLNHLGMLQRSYLLFHLVLLYRSVSSIRTSYLLVSLPCLRYLLMRLVVCSSQYSHLYLVGRSFQHLCGRLLRQLSLVLHQSNHLGMLQRSYLLFHLVLLYRSVSSIRTSYLLVSLPCLRYLLMRLVVCSSQYSHLYLVGHTYQHLF